MRSRSNMHSTIGGEKEHAVSSSRLRPSGGQEQAQLGPPKKAWEWHYRSFLSRNATSVKNAKQASRRSLPSSPALSSVTRIASDLAPPAAGAACSRTGLALSRKPSGIGASLKAMSEPLQKFGDNHYPIYSNSKGSGSKIKSRIKNIGHRMQKRISSQDNLQKSAAAAAAGVSPLTKGDELDVATSSMRRLHISSQEGGPWATTSSYESAGQVMTSSWTPGTMVTHHSNVYGTTPSSMMTDSDAGCSTSLESFGTKLTDMRNFVATGQVGTPPRHMAAEDIDLDRLSSSYIPQEDDDGYFMRSPPASPAHPVATIPPVTTCITEDDCAYPIFPELNGLVGSAPLIPPPVTHSQHYNPHFPASYRSTSLCMIHESSNVSLEQGLDISLVMPNLSGTRASSASNLSNEVLQLSPGKNMHNFSDAFPSSSMDLSPNQLDVRVETIENNHLGCLSAVVESCKSKASYTEGAITEINTCTSGDRHPDMANLSVKPASATLHDAFEATAILHPEDRGQKRQPQDQQSFDACMQSGSFRKAARAGLFATSPNGNTAIPKDFQRHHRAVSMSALTAKHKSSPVIRMTTLKWRHVGTHKSQPPKTSNNVANDKVRKIVFTKFHNSAQFGGNDSASAFLGDDTSIRGGMKVASHYDDAKEENHMTKGKRERAYVIPSSTLMFAQDYLETPSESEGKAAASIQPNKHPVLNAFPFDREDSPPSILRKFTDENYPGLIGPIAFLMCSLPTAPLLPFPHEQNKNPGKRAVDTPNGLILLGAADVALPKAPGDPRRAIIFQSAGRMINPSKKKCWFALYYNYLLEYDDGSWEDGSFTRPSGYAHLQSSVICRPGDRQSFMPECCLELEFDEIHDVNGTSENPNLLRRKKVTIDVKSQEACTRWTELIHWASHLSTDSLYCIGRDNSSSMANIPSNGELGRGRYSTIYSATKTYFRQLSPSDQIGWSSKYRALKVVSKDQFLYRVKRQRERSDTLLREISVQALLSRYVSTTRLDSKTVPILLMFGMFETRSHLVLDLELLSGEDLFRRIITSPHHEHAQGGLSVEEARLIIGNILEALAILKKMGIAHRDVKPANIFMCDSRRLGDVRVKLGDFGMATFVDSDGLVKGRCGTPGYVAPEILMSDVNEGYHNKVDVFSAGVTLYVMLCGYEPFFGESDEELIAANKKAKVEFPKGEWGSVCEDAKDLVRKLLTRDPGTRFDVEDALNHKWIRKSSKPEIDLNVGSRTEHFQLEDNVNVPETGCILS